MLNREVQHQIIDLLKKGESIRKIAKKFEVSHMAVQRLRKNLPDAVPSNKGGRPRKISDRDARHLANLVTSSKAVTPKEALKMLDIDASQWTARRSLAKLGLKAAEKKKEANADKKTCAVEAGFCCGSPKLVIWSDETKINRFQSDGRAWYWNKDPNAVQPHHIKQTVKHGGGSIMVWGCISKNGVGPLVRIDGIMRKEEYLAILQQYLPGVVESMGLAAEKVIFQQDNDPKHTAHVVRNWMQRQKFGNLKWPPQSPDMNPIENLWSHVKSKLAEYSSPPSGVNELWERTRDIWDAIPTDFVLRYTRSMPNRIHELKKSKGYWTSY